MWNIILYQKTFLRSVQLKGGRDFQYPTGMEECFPTVQKSSTIRKFVQLKFGRYLQYSIELEELLKCGKKRRAWNFSNSTEIFHNMKCRR